MKYSILTLSIFVFGICVSQKSDSTKFIIKIDTTDYLNFDLNQGSNLAMKNMLPECPFTIENARKDIRTNSLKIVIHGGFTGFGDMDKSKCDKFQKLYKVQFEYIGCMRNWDVTTEDTYGYNDEVFTFLKSKYGDVVTMDYQAIWK